MAQRWLLAWPLKKQSNKRTCLEYLNWQNVKAALNKDGLICVLSVCLARVLFVSYHVIFTYFYSVLKLLKPT